MPAFAPVRAVLLLIVGALLAPGGLAGDGKTDDGEQLDYLAVSLSDEQLRELAALAPNVNIVTGLDEAERLARAAEFEGADAHAVDEAFLAAATSLRWVQSWSAGVDRYLQMKRLAESDAIVMTNMKGVHGPVIAEHTMAMLLYLSRDFGTWRDRMLDRRWDRRASEKMTALSGRTMLVVGMGGIGSQVARRAHAFDMTVLATVRTKREAPDYVEELGTNADLERFLARADAVVVALPLTDETRGLFDAARFAQMKKGAWFLNIGRGAIVDTDALIAALDAGHLAGAGLDVTDPEPLPADHPLWTRDDVIVTPHVSARAELTLERRWEVLRENMRRFGAGEPLLNVVDKAAGY
jgi:phosphoglycerate dehydrogenase-like enzyme